MKVKLIIVLAAAAAISMGCQPLGLSSSKTFVSSDTQETQKLSTFDEVLTHTQATPLQGKMISEMDGSFNPDKQRYAFTTLDQKNIFLYADHNNATKLVVVNPDGTVKQESFAGYKPERAILNNKILYIGYKGDQAIKFNTDSYDYTEVNKDELDRARAVTDEFVLPDKETAIYTLEGYIYTKQGYIFDVKNSEYLIHDNKNQYYDNADFGVGANLFEIEPRMDQAINLKVIKAKGDKTEKGDSYPIFLDLPKDYDVKSLTHTVGVDGDLVFFAPGVRENGKTGIKMFEIPLKNFSKKEQPAS